MRLTENPQFQAWLEGRKHQAQHGHQCQGPPMACAVCGESDDWIESDTCLACLGVQFGRDLAQQQIGETLIRLTSLTAWADKALVGEIVGEVASFASDLIAQYAENVSPRAQPPKH